MIHLKQNGKQEKDGYFNIYVGDSMFSDSWALKPGLDPDSPFQYFAKTRRGCWKLASQTIEDFEPFSVITLNDLFSWMNKGHSIIISSDYDEGNQEEIIIMAFYFSPNLTFWNEKFSFAQYFREFETNCKNKIEVKYEITFEEAPALRLEFYFKKFHFPIEEILISLEEEIKSIHVDTIELLQKKFQVNLVRTIFDFPEEIKVSCEQYLLYFAQFLRDLGISATSDLKEEAGKVLFSVTPTDNIEALDKIREALGVYLNLPSSPVLYNDSFQSMQLKQQVENLQHSQRMKETEMRSAQYALRLAQQNIENQDKIIIQQNSFIDNQNKIIEKITSKSIMIDSLENKEELEKFCEGFEVGKSEFLIKHFGLHLNPATVLKSVGRRILGKEENESILGLDEETNQEKLK
jgi:hypothetical protein